MHNGQHLRGAYIAARLRRDDDGGLGRRAVAHKHRGLGGGQVHARGLDGFNLLDAARKFLLHGRVVAHLLHELAGGHGGLVFQGVQASRCGFG